MSSERDKVRSTPEWKEVFDAAYKFADPEPNWRDELYRKSEAEFAADFICLAYHAKQNAEKWIPVSERLPDQDGKYLVSLTEYSVRVSGLMIIRKKPVWENYHGFVLAWMPLPAPYLEQAEGGEE